MPVTSSRNIVHAVRVLALVLCVACVQTPAAAQNSSASLRAEIEGINRETAALLKSVGIRSSNGLLEAARTSRARKALAAETGLSEKQLLRWVNLADCMRVRGISREYADLLRASGVDTVKALKYRNPAKLAESMATINRTRIPTSSVSCMLGRPG